MGRWETAYLNSKAVKHLGKYLINLECRREIKTPPQQADINSLSLQGTELPLFHPQLLGDQHREGYGSWWSNKGNWFSEQLSPQEVKDNIMNGFATPVSAAEERLSPSVATRSSEGVASTHAGNSDRWVERFRTRCHQHHLLQNLQTSFSLVQHSSSSLRAGLPTSQTRPNLNFGAFAAQQPHDGSATSRANSASQLSVTVLRAITSGC